MADERSGSGDIRRTLELLWNPEASSGRGPRRSLSIAAIVDKAVEIADDHGLAAVSIRSVAAELGVGTMTLYRYIPSKAEMLDLMLDHVTRPAYDELPAGWHPAMITMGRDVWRLYTTHPWLPFVDQSRPVLGPNAVRSLDLVMGALAGSGLTDQEKVALTVTIESFVATLARTTNAIAAGQEQADVTHEEFWRSQEPALVAAMETGGYPHMAALDEDAFGATNEEVLEFGLHAILDGVQHLLDARAHGKRRASGAGR